MTGISGSTSFNAKHRRQWGIGDPLFESTYLSIEESVPCSFFDWGLSFLNDKEGSAGFKTTEFAASISGVIPFGNQSQIHNIRVGLSPRFTRKSIDLSLLTFSDQLDPKYGLVDQSGNLNPTSFVSPNDGRSSAFFSPAVGISMISTWRADTHRPITTSLGAAIYHVLALGDDFGGIESVLQLDRGAEVPARITAFFEAEFVALSGPTYFGTISPWLFYHKQSDLDYIELGTAFAYNRDLELGLYYHWTPSNDNLQSTNFYTVSADIAIVKTKDHRMDLGLSYSNSVTGLRNLFSDAFEVSFTYHFSKSYTCGALGLDGNSAVPSVSCPGAKFANMKRYEDLWYGPQRN